jgi:hypothetical protein
MQRPALSDASPVYHGSEHNSIWNLLERRTVPYLLRGLLVCRPCGAPMATTERRTGSAVPQRYYGCTLGCGSTTVRAADLERRVLSIAVDLELRTETYTLHALRRERVAWLRAGVTARRDVICRWVRRVTVGGGRPPAVTTRSTR